MNPELELLLQRIETDMSPAAAAGFAAIAAGYFSRTSRADRPVSTRLSADELAGRFAGGFPEDATPLEDVLLKVANDVVTDSNWLYHPRYMGHQVTAPLPAAVWAEQVISALNQSVAVQEMSPAVTLLEGQLIGWMVGLAGYGAGAGGTFTSGGTEATFTALLAARARALPDAWENGLEDPLPVVLCGEHAHYATTRAIAELGLGLKRAVVVATRDFRMDVADLAARLEALHAEGTPVMAVVATAGSTPTGSFDDLEGIADLCEKHRVWLHVDGAHGASALLSAQRRRDVKGIERADSIAWDPHKMMLMPLAAGVLLVREEASLEAAFRQRAPYLFQQTAGERSRDQASRSFLCSRRGDALKLWVALHRYGTRAFGLLYDYFCELTIELHAQIEAHPAFETIHEPECNILCFRHNGSDELNARLRAAYNTRGTGWITSTVLDGRRVLRTTLINPRIRAEHLTAMITELAEIARGL
jgi:L-2,4-diaminobutyrate decarboxylase